MRNQRQRQEEIFHLIGGFGLLTHRLFANQQAIALSFDSLALGSIFSGTDIARNRAVTGRDWGTLLKNLIQLF